MDAAEDDVISEEGEGTDEEEEEEEELLSIRLARIYQYSFSPARWWRMFVHIRNALTDESLDEEEFGQVIHVCCHALIQSRSWRNRDRVYAPGVVERCVYAAQIHDVWECLYVAGAFRGEFDRRLLPQLMAFALDALRDTRFTQVETVCEWTREVLPAAEPRTIAERDACMPGIFSRFAPGALVAYYTEARDRRALTLPYDAWRQETPVERFSRWYFASDLLGRYHDVPPELERILGDLERVLGVDFARRVDRWVQSPHRLSVHHQR